MLPGGSGIVLTWIDAGAGELPAEVGMLPRRWHACLHASSRWVSVRAVSCCVYSMIYHTTRAQLGDTRTVLFTLDRVVLAATGIFGRYAWVPNFEGDAGIENKCCTLDR